MSFLKESTKNSWQPVLSADTATSSYWLNWRVLLCAMWVIFSTILAFVILWKYEGFPRSKDRDRTTQEESSAILYEDETWRPCLKGIHPAWLLAFRVVAFVVLLVLLVIISVADGGSMFYFYTQWTFTLITIYFGLGSLLSMYGCYQYHKKATGDKVDNVEGDAEQGMTDPPSFEHNARTSDRMKDTVHSPELRERQPAGIWGYIFQIIFQMNAGAVMLTDCVFWFLIVPFLTIKDYELNFLTVSMHTMNAVFLLGDAALNCLRFPWFRIGYFCLWTVTYVVVQWVVHASVRLWWPYPFLDLSSPYAPLWYLSVAMLHIPCYGVFALLMKLKHFWLSTRYPDSYQCIR